MIPKPYIYMDIFELKFQHQVCFPLTIGLIGKAQRKKCPCQPPTPKDRDLHTAGAVTQFRTRLKFNCRHGALYV